MGQAPQPHQKQIIFFLVTFTLFLTIAGCNSPKNNTAPTKRVIKAVKVSARPSMDGLANDTAWKKAKGTTVKAARGPSVDIKAVYDEETISTLFVWQDPTNDFVDEVWEYDGTVWKKGPIDDAIAIFWDIDNSIKGFSENGCRSVCHSPQTGMTISGPMTPDGKLWGGAKQRGDIWDISLGISNVRGAVNDYYFGVDESYLKNPSAVRPEISRRHDDFTNKAPIELNKETDPVTGGARPRWRLVSGLTVENTPYPLLNQVEEIADYSVFKPGDRIPYIVFLPLDTPWGGSRDDIAGKGVWKNGTWTVEMQRKLDTGHDDDIIFAKTTGATRYYVFDVAVFDRTIVDHTYTGPISLEIEE